MIKDLKRGLDPDFLFIEPFELVITNEIRTAISMGLRDVTYEIGPFIALVDASTFGYSWQERKSTILNHLIGADVVAISRIDLVEPEYLETIRDTLKDHINSSHLLEVSFSSAHGLDEVAAVIS